MQEVCEFLKKCGAYFIATADGDQPQLRPFGTMDIFEGKLCFLTGRVKNVAQQLKRNPKIAICALSGEQWLRITAEAALEESIEAQAYMLEQYPSLKAQYQPGDGNTEVYSLKNVTACFCSFTEEPRIVRF